MLDPAGLPKLGANHAAEAGMRFVVSDSGCSDDKPVLPIAAWDAWALAQWATFTNWKSAPGVMLWCKAVSM